MRLVALFFVFIFFHLSLFSQVDSKSKKPTTISETENNKPKYFLENDTIPNQDIEIKKQNQSPDTKPFSISDVTNKKTLETESNPELSQTHSSQLSDSQKDTINFYFIDDIPVSLQVYDDQIKNNYASQLHIFSKDTEQIVQKNICYTTDEAKSKLSEEEFYDQYGVKKVLKRSKVTTRIEPRLAGNSTQSASSRSDNREAYYPGGFTQFNRDLWSKMDAFNPSWNLSASKRVIAQFDVLPDGSIGNVIIIQPISTCPECSDVVLRAFQGIDKKFSPALVNGVAQKSSFSIPVILTYD